MRQTLVDIKLNSELTLCNVNWQSLFFYLPASFIQKCSRSDPQLNSCLRNTFNNLRPHLARGIPEIGVPPMEPMKIDHLGIENQAGNIRIKGSFTNVINAGASNFTVKEVRSDLNVSECRNNFSDRLYLRVFFIEIARGSWPLHPSHQVQRTLRSERTGFVAANLVAWRILCWI